jgi:glutamine amidotransferase
VLREAIAALGADIGTYGTFNFLLGDGEHLYARCDTKLCYIVRKAPFGHATLADEDVSIDFAAVTKPRDRVAVVATSPLTRDEVWTHGVPGTLWVFHRGRVAATLESRGRVATRRSA